MKTVAMLCVAVLGAVLLSSCVPESKNPLSDPQTAKCDPRLAGTWMGVGDDNIGWLHFIEGKGAMMDTVLVSGKPGEGADVCIYRMHPTKVGGNDYMNLKPTVPQNWQGSQEAEALKTFGYILAQYEVGADRTLTIRLLGNEAATDAIRAGKLQGEVKESQFGSDVKVTDTPENLARFLETADRQSLFLEPALKFRKVDPAAPSPAAPAPAK